MSGGKLKEDMNVVLNLGLLKLAQNRA